MKIKKYKVIRVDEVVHSLCKIASRQKGLTLTKFVDTELNRLFKELRFTKAVYIYQQESIERENNVQSDVTSNS